MKILIGIGDDQPSINLVQAVAAFGFQTTQTLLVHVLERVGAPGLEGMPVANLNAIAQYTQMLEESAKTLLKKATEACQKAGLANPRGEILHGFAANELLDYAQKNHPDLLAVGSEGWGNIGGLIAGSVGRKLTVSAKQSIFIYRKPMNATGLRAVFATDHSEYAQQCLQRLVKFAPRQLKHVTVMTAYPKPMHTALSSITAPYKVDVSTWFEKQMAERNEQSAKALRTLGIQTDSRVISATPHEAIDQVMQESRADVLILGAQGHGFMERLTLGSISFHEAVSGKHNMLIVRV